MVTTLVGVLVLTASIAPPCAPPAPPIRVALDRLITAINTDDATELRRYVSSSAVADAPGIRERLRTQLGLAHWKSHRIRPVAVCQTSDTTVVALVDNQLSLETDSLSITLTSSSRILRIRITTGIAVHITPADTLTNATRVAAIDSYMTRLAQAGVFSGVVLIDQAGEVLFARAVGDMNETRPNTLQTRFNLASLNKIFTATAILQLVANGRISLENTLGDLLADSTPRTLHAVKIKYLLSHTSGIAPSGDSLVSMPGARFSYSNAGYGILGAVLRRVSGESYEDYLAEHVFRPAGMKWTGRHVLARTVDYLAMGYVPTVGDSGVVMSANPLLHTIPGNSIGGLYSNAEDLRAFALALIGGRLLSLNIVDTMRSPKPELGATEYGYGVLLWRGAGVWGHSGDLPGTNADLEIIPSDRK